MNIKASWRFAFGSRKSRMASYISLSLLSIGLGTLRFVALSEWENAFQSKWILIENYIFNENLHFGRQASIVQARQLFKLLIESALEQIGVFEDQGTLFVVFTTIAEH